MLKCRMKSEDISNVYSLAHLEHEQLLLFCFSISCLSYICNPCVSDTTRSTSSKQDAPSLITINPKSTTIYTSTVRFNMWLYLLTILVLEAITVTAQQAVPSNASLPAGLANPAELLFSLSQGSDGYGPPYGIDYAQDANRGKWQDFVSIAQNDT